MLNTMFDNLWQYLQVYSFMFIILFFYVYDEITKIDFIQSSLWQAQELNKTFYTTFTTQKRCHVDKKKIT